MLSNKYRDQVNEIIAKAYYAEEKPQFKCNLAEEQPAHPPRPRLRNLLCCGMVAVFLLAMISFCGSCAAIYR